MKPRDTAAPQSARGPRDADATDAELLRRIAEGDLGPLGVLYDRHHEGVRQFVARATAGGADTDDITHDTFLTLSSIASRHDGRADARPLLLGIAVQLMRRRRRWLARWASTLGSLAGIASEATHATPEVLASGSEEMRRFEEAISRLSEDKRLVFLLIEREGMRGEEAARVLDIPVNTVWTRLHYARAELRRSLAEGEGSLMESEAP